MKTAMRGYTFLDPAMLFAVFVISAILIFAGIPWQFMLGISVVLAPLLALSWELTDEHLSHKIFGWTLRRIPITSIQNFPVLTHYKGRDGFYLEFKNGKISHIDASSPSMNALALELQRRLSHLAVLGAGAATVRCQRRSQVFVGILCFALGSFMLYGLAVSLLKTPIDWIGVIITSFFGIVFFALTFLLLVSSRSDG